MPMGHCGLNRNTIGVHDIENVSCYYFHKPFLFRGREWKFCAQKSIPSLPESFRVQLLEIKNSSRPEELEVIDQFLFYTTKTKKKRHKCFRLTWAQCEVSRLSIRNLPRVERQPVNIINFHQNLFSPFKTWYTHKKTTFNLHKSTPHP
jgi:hypothetical protein